MLKNFITRKVYDPIIISCRQRSSSDPILGLLKSMLKGVRATQEFALLERGASRCWDLNGDNKNVFIGGLGPLRLEESRTTHAARLIDFDNEAIDKLHIEMKQCPTLLAAKLITTFPKYALSRDRLRVIKLSTKNYKDPSRGLLDCLIACDAICTVIRNNDDFAYYSGDVFKSESNDSFISTFLRTDNKELHASIKFIDGYMDINNLTENDVGLIYTDTDMTMNKIKSRLEKDSSRF
ncbi:uncharacterized protein LOC116345278 [Contarinia nasturtii]|uniref:uncharacterized protein LOC116345278 n=1 Tax=Contarinia nasturtii TaxID=265458 RepID=UPI0012D44972|nr:uncharacterized protein LOC116345278 [Contarinia nasturtii]